MGWVAARGRERGGRRRKARAEGLTVGGRSRRRTALVHGGVRGRAGWAALALVGALASPAAAGSPGGVTHAWEAPASDAAPGERVLALTFDDGPHPRWTPAVLDALDRYGVKGTFFLVGSQVRAYPALAADIVRRGHTVANHTWSHANLARLPAHRWDAEIGQTTAVIESSTGQDVVCARPPYGATNASVARRLADYGVPSVMWTIDPHDWRRPDAPRLAQRVLDRLHPGGVVVLHDGGGDRSQTVGALPRIIEGAQARGYRIVSLCGRDPASPTGALDEAGDAVHAVRVRGWAADPDDDRPLTVRVRLDGSIAAETTADHSRPDVRSASSRFGEHHGFDLAVAAAPGPRRVCVEALNAGARGRDTTIGCRTVKVASHDPVGAFEIGYDGLGRVRAKGWALDPDSDGPATVHVYVDRGGPWAGTAGRPHPASARAAGAGFVVDAPMPGGPHEACAYAINEGPGLTNTPLGCRTVFVDPAPFGYLDRVAPDWRSQVRGADGSHAPATLGRGLRISGWAMDPDTAAATDVAVELDGHVVATARADGDRPDVEQHFPGRGAHHGFDLVVETAPGAHLVCVRALNAGPGDRPTDLGCVSVEVR